MELLMRYLTLLFNFLEYLKLYLKRDCLFKELANSVHIVKNSSLLILGHVLIKP